MTDWREFGAGTVSRCPACYKGREKVGAGLVVRVRLLGPKGRKYVPAYGCVAATCERCRCGLEIQHQLQEGRDAVKVA